MELFSIEKSANEKLSLRVPCSHLFTRRKFVTCLRFRYNVKCFAVPENDDGKKPRKIERGGGRGRGGGESTN